MHPAPARQLYYHYLLCERRTRESPKPTLAAALLSASLVLSAAASEGVVVGEAAGTGVLVEREVVRLAKNDLRRFCSCGWASMGETSAAEPSGEKAYLGLGLAGGRATDERYGGAIAHAAVVGLCGGEHGGRAVEDNSEGMRRERSEGARSPALCESKGDESLAMQTYLHPREGGQEMPSPSS